MRTHYGAQVGDRVVVTFRHVDRLVRARGKVRVVTPHFVEVRLDPDQSPLEPDPKRVAHDVILPHECDHYEARVERLVEGG